MNGRRIVWLSAVMILLYAITWVFGVPMVRASVATLIHPELDMPICSETITNLDRAGEDESAGCIRVIRTFPILPFLVATRYDIEARWGHGAWKLVLWYGVGSVSVLSWTVWTE